ncbi:Uncharacterised protein [Porphyromonas macacae]|uniref:YD repeat (Two copies) n=1 Tax=Porphyromonas macacae TaxID=28115 RepID=A0A379DG29_9PORP|nr:RHS repeat protein [Porphyromonas macacae]SUB77358.1 Uncharacterised protein [Porphyromonas macacae]
MKKVIFLLFFLSPFILFSQKISICSPTATNLGLYGEIPVSYYTGIPDISIPLYEIKGKKLRVPLRLRYHPAGIRPEIHPGPVGLGWSLEAGGVISRTVRGSGVDESLSTSSFQKVRGFLTYAHPQGWMAQSDWKKNAENALKNNCTLCREKTSRSFLEDIEPDEFHFSLPNLSGKFYFDHTGKIQVQCDRPVKVIAYDGFITPDKEGIRLDYADYSGHIRAFKSFILMDEEGTQYKFGGPTAIEFSDPISYGRKGLNEVKIPTGELLHATSWFLTEIISADSLETIRLEYERGPFVSQLYRSWDYFEYKHANGQGTQWNSLEIDGTFISPVYLNRIEVFSGKARDLQVDFSYSVSNELKYTEQQYRETYLNTPETMDQFLLLTKIQAIPRLKDDKPLYSLKERLDHIQWLKLDSISVKTDTLTSPLRQIHLSYNDRPEERLFLEALRISAKAVGSSLDMLNYGFIYKNREKLPPYLACMTDHWGFNNGKKISGSGFIFENKKPDSRYTDSGVLSGIRYPTGGTVSFEYELHDYGKVVDTKDRTQVVAKEGKASGLRIKKITSEASIREFFYRKAPDYPLSSGVLNMLPQYRNTIKGKDCGGKGFEVIQVKSMPVIPLTKENEGLYMGYTSVCERISGIDGYVRYDYTNHDNGYTDTRLQDGMWNREIFITSPHCSRYFERGRLKAQMHYNGKGMPVARHITEWARYGSQGEDNPRAFFFEGLPFGYSYCSSAAYLHYCYKFLPARTEDTLYDPTGQNPVTVCTEYTYGDGLLLGMLRTKIQNLSDGSRRRETFKYPSDYQSSPYKSMVEKYMLNPVVEYSVFNGSTLVEKVQNDYERHHNLFYAPKESRHQQGGGPLESRFAYRYDSRGNVREVVKDGAERTVYIWGYDYLYPIAEILNADIQEVEKAVKSVFGVENLEALSEQRIPDESKLRNGSLQRALPQALVTTYTYRPQVGMTSGTDSRGVTTSYAYDGLGRLREIRDHAGKVQERYEYHYRNR